MSRRSDGRRRLKAARLLEGCGGESAHVNASVGSLSFGGSDTPSGITRGEVEAFVREETKSRPRRRYGDKRRVSAPTADPQRTHIER